LTIYSNKAVTNVCNLEKWSKIGQKKGIAGKKNRQEKSKIDSSLP